MKQHAQAILLFTGYPLEPIVALEIKKSFQSSLPPAAQGQRNTQKERKNKKQQFSSN